MLRRTKGRFLLALLVATGFAGTTGSSSMKVPERKNIVHSFKEIRYQLPQLGEMSLNNEMLEHCSTIVNAEIYLWRLFQKKMQQPTNAEKRVNICWSDAVVVANAGQLLNSIKTPKTTALNNPVDLLKKLKKEQLRYVKTTTQDLRNHVFETPAGAIDGYQFLLLIAAKSKQSISEIINL